MLNVIQPDPIKVFEPKDDYPNAAYKKVINPNNNQ